MSPYCLYYKHRPLRPDKMKTCHIDYKHSLIHDTNIY